MNIHFWIENYIHYYAQTISLQYISILKIRRFLERQAESCSINSSDDRLLKFVYYLMISGKPKAEFFTLDVHPFKYDVKNTYNIRYSRSSRIIKGTLE